ncbi:13042_t:CDS:2 [Ambispora gerdemannii]|uniref:13042_t:CDS:1 n=1 Tax=Ambispora gerdemannii TaxID=144530 RepID=A0A9N8V0X6_9GLOM|nr:13042_t:CDS:2 [Ambispora gerdemannii]
MAQEKIFKKCSKFSLIVTIIALLLLFTTPKGSLADLTLKNIIIYDPVRTDKQLNITYFVYNDLAGQFTIQNLAITLVPLKASFSSNISVNPQASLLGPNRENATQTEIFNLTKEIYDGTWSLMFTEKYSITSSGQTSIESQGMNITFPPYPTSTTSYPGNGPITYISTISSASYQTITTTNAAGQTYLITGYVPPIIQTVIVTPNPTVKATYIYSSSAQPTPSPTGTEPITYISTISPASSKILTTTNAAGETYLITSSVPPIIQTVIVTPIPTSKSTYNPSSSAKTRLMMSNNEYEWWSNKIYLMGIHFFNYQLFSMI